MPVILQFSGLLIKPDPGLITSSLFEVGQVKVKVFSRDTEYNHPSEDLCNKGFSKAGDRCCSQFLLSTPFNRDRAQLGALSLYMGLSIGQRKVDSWCRQFVIVEYSMYCRLSSVTAMYLGRLE